MARRTRTRSVRGRRTLRRVGAGVFDRFLGPNGVAPRTGAVPTSRSVAAEVEAVKNATPEQLAVLALKDEIKIYKEEKMLDAVNALPRAVKAIKEYKPSPQLAAAAKQVIPEVEADTGIADEDKGPLIDAIKTKMMGGGRRSRRRRGGVIGTEQPLYKQYLEEKKASYIPPPPAPLGSVSNPSTGRRGPPPPPGLPYKGGRHTRRRGSRRA